MSAISVAVALPSGEIASSIIDAVETHPLLEMCGVARSFPDLLRLLERFHPTLLFISPSLFEDLEPSAMTQEEVAALHMPLAFLLPGPEMHWEEEGLAGLLSFPLRYCGIISRNIRDEDSLFHLIKARMDIHLKGENPPAPTNLCTNKQPLSNFITITGCKGGVGTTLIACALAAALSGNDRRVLLLEMDHNLSQLLYLKPRDEGKTLLDLLPMAEDVSWDLVRMSVHRHGAGFFLLPYGHRNEDGLVPQGSALEPLLRNLLFLFDVVIQDFPNPLCSNFIHLLHHSPTVLLVSLPDTLSATCARRTAVFMRRINLDYGRFRLIVNRCDSHHALRPEELARAVGTELLAMLPDDPRSGLDFAELGGLPAADSPLGRAIYGMASTLGFECMAPRRPPALLRLRRKGREAEEGFFTGSES